MTDLPLNTRAGLPKYLRVLADQFPRSTWEGHPNFSQPTEFWLSRHALFRDLMVRLQTNSAVYLDTSHAQFGSELSHYTGFFLNQLHGHHSIEDNHYFPQFAGLDDRLEHGFELLDADHHALDAQIAALATATNTVIEQIMARNDASAAVATLLKTQNTFAGFLERHLLDEEDLIVPLILNYAPEIG